MRGRGAYVWAESERWAYNIIRILVSFKANDSKKKISGTF
jgi:hypothetical protein